MKKQIEKDSIEFVTNKGTKVILIFEKGEYRAYEVFGQKKEPMYLGAVDSAALAAYIKRMY